MEDAALPVTADPSGETGVATGTTRTSPRGWGRDAVALAMVLALFAVVQWWLFVGPQPFDPAHYMTWALDFPSVKPNFWTLRIGLLMPVWALVRLFGPSEIVYFGVPIASSVLLVVSTYAVMRLFRIDRVVSACAAALVVLNQEWLLDSTSLFPDVIATATYTSAVALLVLSARDDDAGRTRRALVAAVLAGAVFAWTYLTREFSVILIPALLAAIVLLRYSWRRFFALVAGALVTGSAELIYGAVRYGDPLERVHQLLHSAHSYHTDTSEWTPYLSRVHNIVDAALVFPHQILAWKLGWGLIALLVVFAVGFVRRPTRDVALLAAWLLFFWVAMAALGMLRTKAGTPVLGIGYVRYWYPILPALVMGGYIGVSRLIRGVEPSALRARAAQFAAVGVTAAILVPGSIEFSHCAAKTVWDTEPVQRWDELRSWLGGPTADHYDEILAVGGPSWRLAHIYARTTLGHRVWTGRIKTLPSHLTAAEASGALILVDRRYRALPHLRLPSSWSPVFVSSDGHLAFLAYHAGADTVTGDALTRWTRPPPPLDGKRGSCGLSPYRRYGSVDGSP